MSWESRGGRGRYYTRSRRVGGKVVREYVGRGPLAEAAAATDEAARLAAAAARAEYREDREGVEAARSCSAAADEAARAELHATMAARGYHCHDRSTWRRGGMKSSKKATGGAHLARAALEADDGAAVPTEAELRAFLTGVGPPPPPPAADPGGLAELATAAWAGLIGGEEAPFRDVVLAQLAAFKADLRAGDSPLERLLVDQLTVTFLEATYFSARAAQTAAAELTAAHREFLLKGADRAHRRVGFLVKQLATVRRLIGADEPPVGGPKRPHDSPG